MKETGSIKFNCNWIKAAPLPYAAISQLNDWRDKLYDAGLIGANAGGIGYGNISKRLNGNTFIITGSSTGKIKKLTEEHYTTVTGYDIRNNILTTEGTIVASSESLTHAAIYESLPQINSVMHVHHYALWERLLTTHPATDKTVEYGTPAMAEAIQHLLATSDPSQVKLFAMGGHEEGIISFGKDADEAGLQLLYALANL